MLLHLSARHERLGEGLIPAADDNGIDLLKRQAVSRFWLEVLRTGSHGLIGVKGGQGSWHILLGLGVDFTVIDERADWDKLCELWNSAIVVGVEVREEQVVDLLEAGIVRRGKNAICVSRCLRVSSLGFERPGPWESRIHQQ